jgi:hypothetical protein
MTVRELGEWGKKRYEQLQKKLPAGAWQGIGATAILLGLAAAATGFTNKQSSDTPMTK